jgi:hypothetical protein
MQALEGELGIEVKSVHKQVSGDRPIDTITGSADAAPLTPIADATEFNSHFNWENSTGLNTTVFDLLGTAPRDGKQVLPYGDNSPGTVRWQLDAGSEIDVRPGGDDGIITFGFFDGQRFPGQTNDPHRAGIVYGEGQGYTPFTEAQKDAARIAVGNWDDFIAPDFQEVTVGPGVSNWAQNTADIWLANTFTGPAQAWGYYPGGSRVSSDVWIADPNFNTSNAQLADGFYGLITLNHELGHTLGLSHPGSYNFGDDNDGDGFPDPINYTGDAFYFQDSRQFTIMSYFDGFETGQQTVDWNTMRFIYASTPMVDDVFVIQQKYGAETHTRVGDTTYGFNATADVTNTAMSFHNGELASVFTIYDAAGNDTLDLSGYYSDSVIDLREGAYSSAGGFGMYDATQAALDVDSLTKEQFLGYINANNDDAGQAHRDGAYDLYFGGRAGANEGIPWNEITNSVGTYVMEQNIGIAYGAIIENAIGGEGNDRINGNQVDNIFTGNGGADTFIIADYSGEIADATDSTDWSKTVTDHSIDTITDFTSGEDKIDLTSFGDLDSTDVSYDGTDLHISANGHDYTVHLLGASIDTTNDIIYG